MPAFTREQACASGAFWDKGGARKRADVFLDKEKRSKTNFAPTWWKRMDSNHRS